MPFGGEFKIGGVDLFIGSAQATFTAPIDPLGGAVIDITNPEAPIVSPVSVDEFVRCDGDPTLGRQFTDLNLWLRGSGRSPFRDKVSQPAYTIFAYPGYASFSYGRVDQLGLEESRERCRAIPPLPKNYNAPDYYLILNRQNEVYYRDTLHPYARSEFVLDQFAAGVVGRSLDTGFDQLRSYIKQKPELLERAVNIFSQKLAHAPEFTEHPFFYGHQAYYRQLQNLLGLEHDIFTNDFTMTSFVAMKTTRKGSMGELVGELLQAKQVGGMFRAADIGTGLCLMPFYIQQLVKKLDPSRAVHCVGTELEGYWKDEKNISKEHAEELSRYGLGGLSKSDELHEGVFLSLKPDLPSESFDLITWIRPYVGNIDYRSSNDRLAASLPWHLSERAKIVIDIVPLEHELSLRFIRDIADYLSRSRIPFKLDLVRFDEGLRNYGMTGTFEERMATAQVLNGFQINPSPNLFVFSIDRSKPFVKNEGFPPVYDTFLSAYSAAMKAEIEEASDPQRKHLLEMSKQVVESLKRSG